MAQGSTVPCRYWVICGNPTKDGSFRSFNFEAEAPAALCLPHLDNGPKPDPDDAGIFITTLVDRHNNEILHSRAWRCVTCDKRATELLHQAVPVLSPVADRADFEKFFPTVIDICAPICISGGECDRAANKVAQDFAKSALIQKPWQIFEDTKTCDTCGKKSGVKVCSGCKLIAYVEAAISKILNTDKPSRYCSKECQAKGWPRHKRQCKHAQKEARRAEVASS